MIHTRKKRLNKLPLRDHELEVRLPDLELRLTYQAFVELGLSSRVVAAKDIGLVGLVVRGIDAMQRKDLLMCQTRGRILTRATG